ncbi:MAG: hypothetical protein K6T51_05525 [Rubrobacteraceae bacterium]|uniref:hypothetical protein n=1 Tax=Rubrobacter TaxID=42255 RepID=UPI0023610F41|nr:MULTISPECIES: hypothetical protein [Rubrobacter]MBX6764193.1 hypothetical protein [Rubrobacteraceae bacterium]MCL6438046.1 hypothetical protein [Rubrobacteraceae bacterium]
MADPGERTRAIGYEFAREDEARGCAAELARRFSEREIVGLRIYRIRWNGDYLVEAVFGEGVPEQRVRDARAILGELGAPIREEDLEDYKRATEAGFNEGLPTWIRRLFGR